MNSLITSFKSDISPALLNKIIFNIENHKTVSDIKIYDSNPSNLVFEMPELQGIIFKIGVFTPSYMNKRFKNIECARKISQKLNFNSLKIPQATLLNVKIRHETFALLVEEKVNITADTSVQEKLYSKTAMHLNDAIKQLTKLILETGWCDVEWRNAPISNEVDSYGNRKIVLVDLEHFGNPEEGLFGGFSTGLIGLVNKEQAEKIIKIATKRLPWTSRLETISKQAYEKRKFELEENVKLQEFYSSRSIEQGNELINLNIDSLNLPLNLQQPTQDILKEINELITKASGDLSIKRSRNLIIKGQDFSDLLEDNFKISENQLRRHRISTYRRTIPGSDKELMFIKSNELTVMGICLSSLVKAGAIFKGEYINNDWVVQA